MSSPPYVKAKFTRRSYKVTERIPNSQRACHQIFLLYVLPPPSVSTRPGVTDTVGSRSKGSPMGEGHTPLWTSVRPLRNILQRLLTLTYAM